MSDFNSSLPVRTQNNGDVAVKIVDGTTVSQALAVDASGAILVKLEDGAGTALTSQANGGQRALDVGVNVAGVQIDPRSIRALTSSDVVTVDQGTTPWVGKDQSDGPVAPGAAASFSSLGGAVYHSSAPTLTDGQQAALQSDSSGKLLTNTTLGNDTNYGTIGSNTLRSAAQIGNASGAADFNFGSGGAQTLRVAALPGNASGLADFNNGATSAQTIRVAANLAVAGANVSGTNPIPVSITSAPVGTTVNNYNTSSALAAGITSNHIYTITSGKTFNGKKIHATASGKMKVEVRVSPDGSTYSTVFVAFNSTANPNIDIDMDELVFLESGVGSTIEVIRTNLDLLAQDVYSTISGVEV